MGIADPTLVDVFRNLRRDARNDPKPVETAQTFNIEFCFDGVGALPSINDIVIWNAGRLSARLIGVELVADVAGNATVDLRIGTMATWPASAVIYDVIPTLAAMAAVEIDITNWLVSSLQPFDILQATLITVEVPITTLTLTLIYRRLKWPSANPDLVDNAGNNLVLESGASLILRT